MSDIGDYMCIKLAGQIKIIQLSYSGYGVDRAGA